MASSNRTSSCCRACRPCGDSHLSISGSIKARGGIYEVLKHAEDLAPAAGPLRLDDDYACLYSDAAWAFFGDIGSPSALPAISVCRSESSARAWASRPRCIYPPTPPQWKKDRLRGHGVRVVEYASDYSAAVAEGHRQAEADPHYHFVDESSTHLVWATGGSMVPEAEMDEYLAIGRHQLRNSSALVRRPFRRSHLYAI